MIEVRHSDPHGSEWAAGIQGQGGKGLGNLMILVEEGVSASSGAMRQ